MEKTKIIALLVFTMTLIYTLNGCGSKDSDKKSTDTKHEEMDNKNAVMTSVSEGKYFCPMHPLQQSNDAGARCSICRMKLNSKDEHNSEMMNKHGEMEKKHAGMKDFLHFEIQLVTLKSDECERIIKKALKKTDGVMDFYIDILESKIHLYIDKSKTTKENVEKTVSELGFDANNIKANQDAASKLPEDCK